MKHYEFLLFDADNTLLDFDADMAQAFAACYQEAGFPAIAPYSPAMLTSYCEINDRWWKKFEAGACTKQELFENRFAEYRQRHGFPGEARQINALYFENLSKFGSLLPGAEPMLARLSKKHKIYIVTNGNAVSQAARIEISGLGAYILGCFVSEAVGVGKPDIRYFRHVFSHIPGFDRERAIVIGDGLSSDILGAHLAGTDSIWYNPSKHPNPEKIPCTYQAESFSRIVEILEGGQ